MFYNVPLERAKLIVKLLPASDPISHIRIDGWRHGIADGLIRSHRRHLHLLELGLWQQREMSASRCDCHLPHLQRTRTQRQRPVFTFGPAAGTGQVAAFSDRIKRSKGPKATPRLEYVIDGRTGGDEEHGGCRIIRQTIDNKQCAKMRSTPALPALHVATPSLGPRVLCISLN
jgi:hypothetical protein